MARHTGIIDELLWAYSERKDGSVHPFEFYAHLRGVDIDKMSTQTQFQEWFRQLMKVAIENDCYGCITTEERMLRLYAPIIAEIRTSGRYNAFEKYTYQRLMRYKFRSGVERQ